MELNDRHSSAESLQTGIPKTDGLFAGDQRFNLDCPMAVQGSSRRFKLTQLRQHVGSVTTYMDLYDQECGSRFEQGGAALC